jgi:hypothetical protein
MAVQIQLRRGTASQWTSANPILAEGEMGVELDTGKWKFGNGTGTWSILAYGSGAALLDADKGDITVSGTGTVWTIDTGAVTYAKMQAASTTSRVLGSSSTSTTIQELTLGTGLSLSGTTLSATGATVADADYGNITVSGTGTVWTIDNGVVTYAKMQAASTNSKVIGSSSTSTTLTELTLGTGLSLSGTTLTATGGVTDGDKGDITVSSSGASWVIDSGAVTYAKLQTASTNSKLLGTSSTSTTFAELTLGTGLSLSGTTLTATGGVTDGDKGDITVSGTGSSWVIDNQAVTYAKIQNVSATDKLLGRSTAGAGSVEEITCTAAGRAILDDADASAQRTTLGLGTLATQSGTFSGTSSGTNTGDQTITLTSDVTGSGTGSFATTIAAGVVSTSKLGGDITTAGKALLDDADAAAQRTTLGLGTLATQSGTFSGTSSGTNTGDQTISLTGDVTGSGTGSFAATIANDAVTNAKLANMTASTIKARITASTGDPEDATLTQVLDLVGSAAQGDILYRGASTWTRLAAGTSGHYLKTNGTGSDPAWAAVSASGGGSTNVWIPAAAWIPRTTTGAGIDSRELSTNKINTDELLFDAGTDEFAQAMIVMPNNWNAGTVTAKFHWTASTGSGDVVWGLQGRAYANDDALDQAMGTAQTATDTLTATNDVDISPATSAITLGGTAASGNPVIFQVYRDADAGGDTLGADARLLGVEISYTAS